MWRQYELICGVVQRIGWLESDAPLRPGTLVTLKRDEFPKRRWIVVTTGTIALSEPPLKEWRVGGLV